MAYLYVLIRWNLPVSAKYAGKVSKMQLNGWHGKRLDIWQKYAMPSLIRQNYRDFKVWLICDPCRKEENSELQKTLTDPRFKIVTDFDSQIDRLAKRGNLSDQIIFARMDSDDMAHPEMLWRFRELADNGNINGRRFIQALGGYAYHLPSGNLYQWNHDSPPFFATFRARAWIHSCFPQGPAIINHKKVKDIAAYFAGGTLFCVTLSDTNICNSIRASWLGEKIKGRELEEAKRDYGF